jgi:hypothetical protein
MHHKRSDPPDRLARIKQQQVQQEDGGCTNNSHGHNSISQREEEGDHIFKKMDSSLSADLPLNFGSEYGRRRRRLLEIRLTNFPIFFFWSLIAADRKSWK